MKVLSIREQEIIELIAYENTSLEIAGKLFISHETVKSHRKKLFAKLSARNSVGLIRRAYEEGILQLHQRPVFD